MECPKCGVILHISDWPFCPHGKTGLSTFRDDIPGGLTVENYGPKPMTFYSHTERRAYMKEHGLQETERFSPAPGTDIDPQGIPNPVGYMDPQTLENARILVSRQGESFKPFDALEDGVMRDMFSGVLTKRDAKAIGEGDVHRLSRLGRRIDAQLVDPSRSRLTE